MRFARLVVAAGPLLFLACAAQQCPVGLVVAGTNRKITLPSGGVPAVMNVDLGAIADETTYNHVSEKIADLTQLLSLCCERKIAAQRTQDEAGSAYWADAERKCFEQFMRLQSAVGPAKKSERAAAAPAGAANPAAGSSKPMVSSSSASLRAWLRKTDLLESRVRH